MPRKSNIRWYLFTNDTHTKDEIVQGLLQKSEYVDPSNPTQSVSVKLGKKLPMIEVPEYFFLNYATKSQAHSVYDLLPYTQEGDGIAREWKLDKRKKTARNKKVRDLRRKLEEKQKKLAERTT